MKNKKQNRDLPGYPHYPAVEDIYVNEDRLQDINPDDESKITEENQEEGMNQKDYTNTQTGDDLDIPGAELDDRQEEIGSEDEENNYYS
ncbi:MAG: hypothetical protein ACXVC6_05800 [Bacteroidia bacterium]